MSEGNEDAPQPFDFAAAAAFKLKRARDLLAQEEARNKPLADDFTAPEFVEWRTHSLSTASPGASHKLVMEAKLYDGTVVALQSAGARVLRPPGVETHDGNLSYTIRARHGIDLYEIHLSSQRNFVLVRATQCPSAFDKGGSAANERLCTALDLTVPLIGQVYTLMLDINRYVVHLADGSTALVNETLLLANLNENIFGKFGLEALTTDLKLLESHALGRRGLWGTGLSLPTTILYGGVAITVLAIVYLRFRRKK